MSAQSHSECTVASGTAYAQGCRCDECTRAHRQRCRRRQLERFADRVEIDGRLVATGSRDHGTAHTYGNHGCRCEPCTAANMRASRARREARALRRASDLGGRS